MPLDSTASEAIHHTNQQRFEILRAGSTARLEYTLADQQMTIHHTFVPVALRGKNIAGQLAQAAFDYARQAELKVVPACSYIGVYARRHPAVADLLAE